MLIDDELVIYLNEDIKINLEENDFNTLLDDSMKKDDITIQRTFNSIWCYKLQRHEIIEMFDKRFLKLNIQ